MYRNIFRLVVVVALLSAFSVPAQNVIFSFSGVIQTKLDASNMLPASIAVNSTFNGTVSFGSAVDQAPADQTYGYYIYSPTGGLYISVTIGTNTIASLAATNSPYDVFIIHDEQAGTPYDELAFEVLNLRLNGAIPPGVARANMDVDLQDYSSTGLKTDALPTYAPTLAQFPSRRWTFVGSGPLNNTVYYVEGTITNLAPVFPPPLNISRPQGGNATISWSNIASGFFLEQSPTPTGGWSQVTFPYSTNGGTISRAVPASSTNGYFRLRKP